jgi:hypothetical protein
MIEVTVSAVGSPSRGQLSRREVEGLMKSSFLTYVMAVLLALAFNQTSQSQQRQGETPLTNAAVVKLSKAGFKEKTIISVIFARVPGFDLSTDRMIELKRSGVTEKVILAMLARQDGSDSLEDSDWGSEVFSGGTSDPKLDPTGNSGSSVGIFGSSSGQKSRTQTNGSNGGSTGETTTTGSATVRILRPASEAGTEATKLEKTKSLTNESVVELVEAGFSEGTIIRRIEQSPVDFDLAAPKLEELRKRRVSDKILTAMKTAMGDETSK